MQCHSKILGLESRTALPVQRQCAWNQRVISSFRRPGIADHTVAQGLARDIFTSQAANLEGDPLSFLDVTEAYWKALRLQSHEPERKGPKVVTYAPQGANLPQTDFDVVVCGGTLGLMVAATLQRRGHKVAVIDKRLIQGRTQEWNISWGELTNLHRVGLLSEEELRGCIASEFNPVRVGFAGGPDMWINDCLNLGVSPCKLLDLIKAKFVAAGGVLMENHSFRAAEVVPGQGVRLTLTVHGTGAAGAELSPGDVNRPNGLGGNSSNMAPPFTPVDSNGETPTPSRTTRRKMELGCRLLLDCMGHYSDIVKQIRGRAKPDGMCLVVGSCAEGFPTANNTFADLLYTIDDAKDDMQMFWEAFPAEGGTARTTYMFSYSDAQPSRPSFESLLDHYFEQLKVYQGVPAEQLKFKRVLFGGFPCWSDGPLQPAFDHIMQIGDASATQSPLSFGGFGAMVRHLSRLTEGVDDALRCNALSRDELRCLHPYQPSLSASWLFQRSMSVGPGQLRQAMVQEAAARGAVVDADYKAEGALAPAPSSWIQLPKNHVNEVLACNFGVMKVLGDRVMRPFLQDTIQLAPLSMSMAGMMLANPIAITRVLFQVGPKTLSTWFGHYAALIFYTFAHNATTPIRAAVRGAANSSLNDPAAPKLQITPGAGQPPQEHPWLKHSTDAGRSRAGFKFRRLLDAWEVGSSSDYTYHPSDQPLQIPETTKFTAPEKAPVEPVVAPALSAPLGNAGAVKATVKAVPIPVPVLATTKEVGMRR